MTIDSDKAECRSFVDTCDADQLAEITAFAIRTMPQVERVIRALWRVIIASSPIDSGKEVEVVKNGT